VGSHLAPLVAAQPQKAGTPPLQHPAAQQRRQSPAAQGGDAAPAAALAAAPAGAALLDAEQETLAPRGARGGGHSREPRPRESSGGSRSGGGSGSGSKGGSGGGGGSACGSGSTGGSGSGETSRDGSGSWSRRPAGGSGAAVPKSGANSGLAAGAPAASPVLVQISAGSPATSPVSVQIAVVEQVTPAPGEAVSWAAADSQPPSQLQPLSPPQLAPAAMQNGLRQFPPSPLQRQQNGRSSPQLQQEQQRNGPQQNGLQRSPLQSSAQVPSAQPAQNELPSAAAAALGGNRLAMVLAARDADAVAVAGDDGDESFSSEELVRPSLLVLFGFHQSGAASKSATPRLCLVAGLQA